jgi:hypothetical protein
MRLHKKNVKENRERIDVRQREYVNDDYIHKSTPELMRLSTFELLYLLKTVRKERKDVYHQLNLFLQAKEEGIIKYQNVEKETGRDYMYFTKKSFVLENIVGSRLGYVPERITEDFLLSYLDEIKSGKKSKPMVIRIKPKTK